MDISVIIPCRNEKLYISQCIDAIYKSKFQTDMQLFVIIVDGQSDDGTLEIIKKEQEKYPTLILVDNPKKVTPYAFNLGILSKEADFYQIVGARQLISENYIQEGITKLLNNPEIWCVGGKVENIFIDKQSELISKAMATSFGMGLGNFRIIEKSTFVDTVGTPLYPKFVFDKIGYFDEELVRNQDDEFNFRVTKAGGKILLFTEISLKYYVRAKIQGLWKQFFQYGYWKVFVNKKHKAITTYRQLIPPLFVLYCLIVPFLLFVNKLFFLVALSPLLLYILTSLYFGAKSAKNIPELLRIAVVFPILHFSYGFGYLRGIFDFYILNKKPGIKQKSLSR